MASLCFNPYRVFSSAATMFRESHLDKPCIEQGPQDLVPELGAVHPAGNRREFDHGPLGHTRTQNHDTLLTEIDLNPNLVPTWSQLGPILPWPPQHRDKLPARPRGPHPPCRGAPPASGEGRGGSAAHPLRRVPFPHQTAVTPSKPSGFLMLLPVTSFPPVAPRRAEPARRPTGTPPSPPRRRCSARGPSSSA